MNEDEIIEKYESEKNRLRGKYIFITIIVALIVAIISSEFTLWYYASRDFLGKKEVSEDPTKNIEAIAATLKNFRKVIDENYIGEIDEQKMLDETIKGYVNGLGDEYSEYMTKEEWESFEANTLGNYVGIGIYMGLNENGYVVVVRPMKDSPAEKVGMQSGDIIVNVNDENVLGEDSETVSNKIKSEPGTKVKVTVYRQNEDKYIDFEIERAEIKVYHVESEMLDNNIGYISLLTFDEGCSVEFEEAYDKLKSEGANKIILDLRDNTGGLVKEALAIIDMFLPKGETMLITVDSKNKELISRAEKDPLVDTETIVLVNHYSASASEILVGALKDSGKARVVGTQTYGKGVIQSVFSIKDGSVLKLTVDEYYTPNKTKINKVGIEPDEIVEQDEETEEDEQLDKAIELFK